MLISDSKEIKTPSFSRDFEFLKSKFDKANKGYIESVIDFLRAYAESKNKNEAFSITTDFSRNADAWQKELRFLWQLLNDEQMTALFLGQLLQKSLIDSEEKFYKEKSNINGRDFDTCFYWKD